MLSRAHLLLQRDLDEFKEKTTDEEFHIDLISPDNIFEWAVKMKGFQGSIWKDGIFILILKFGEKYNEEPPQVSFYTVPFHPNVDPTTGQVELDTAEWDDSRSIIKVLSFIQDLLCNPVLEKNVLNKQARDMYIKSPHTYQQIVADCVRNSQKIEFGLSPGLEDECKSPKQNPVLIRGGENIKLAPKSYRNFKKISFEDYHFTWSDIATCKAKRDVENSYLESLKKNSKLYEMHTGKKLNEMAEDLSTEEEEELSILIYGNFNQRKPNNSKRNSFENVKKMENLNLPNSSDQMNTDEENAGLRLEPNDYEVNDLLDWSSNLDSKLLDCP